MVYRVLNPIVFDANCINTLRIGQDMIKLDMNKACSMAFTTSAVIDGVCHGFEFYESQLTKTVLGITYFVGYYVGLFLLFVVCYGLILIAIRRQAKVMSGHFNTETAQPSAAKIQAHKLQSNVIKTTTGSYKYKYKFIYLFIHLFLRTR